MKRLAPILAYCLPLLCLAATDTPMWQRNHGAWEAVVRVSKENPYYDFGDFRAVTNGLVTLTFPHEEATNVVWLVEYDFYNSHSGNSIVAERKSYSWRFVGIERVWPVPEPMAWTNDPNSLIFKTNANMRAMIKDNFNTRWDYTSFTPIRTNVVDITRRPIVRCGDLPCRFGVPATITVNLPYTDLMELLPLDWPDTHIHVRTGFDGYLLLRFDEDEMRLTIKRLLPEMLPYERPNRNIRVNIDDLLNGV